MKVFHKKIFSHSDWLIIIPGGVPSCWEPDRPSQREAPCELTGNDGPLPPLPPVTWLLTLTLPGSACLKLTLTMKHAAATVVSKVWVRKCQNLSIISDLPNITLNIFRQINTLIKYREIILK